MTPTQQIIESLLVEPEKWTQGEHTLNHENGTELWTSNLPYLSIGIWSPRRKTSIVDKICLQLAVNRWHRMPIVVAKK